MTVKRQNGEMSVKDWLKQEGISFNVTRFNRLKAASRHSLTGQLFLFQTERSVAEGRSRKSTK